MTFRESRHEQIDVFHLCGDIDMQHAPALRALFVGKSERRCPALIVDLSGVQFIDSTGIAVLLEYLRDASAFDGQFCIGGLTDHVRAIFDILRLDQAMPIFNDLIEAKSALSKGSVPRAPEPLLGRARKHSYTAGA